MSTTRTIGREIGTALAVLAIYLLTILAPLHQARASQLAFEELGYITSQSSWVLCNPGGVPGEDPDLSVAKCPANGVGKNEFALPPSGMLRLDIDRVALAAPILAPAPAVPLRLVTPPGGSRAPPVLV